MNYAFELRNLTATCGRRFIPVSGELLEAAAEELETLQIEVDRRIADAVAADRERICNSLPGGCSVDPQWVADMVRATL